MKLYVIKKEAHPENLKQLRKMDYSAYQRYCRLVNTVIGMENGDVISQFFKEIVNEEAMQIMERQRQQHIEEDKYQHKLPQDKNLQNQQQYIIIEQHRIEQQHIIEQQEQQ